MRLSDKLKQERASLLTKLEAMNKKATDEGRELDAGESAEWDRDMRAADDLATRIAREEQRENLRRGETGGQRVQLTDERGEPLTVLRSADKLVDRHRGASVELMSEFSVGALVRGIAAGKWNGREGLRRALGESTLPGGGYAVPEILSSAWLDALRAQSVMMQAGSLTLPMSSATLRVAGIATDPVPSSRKENTNIAASDPTFRGVDFKAKSYAVLVTSSLELLADSPNAETMIEAAILGAMATTFDGACLNGDGSVAGDLDNVLGVLNVPGVVDIPVAAGFINYDAFIDAVAAIGQENITADVAIYSPLTAGTISKTKTGLAGDNTTLVMPPEVAALRRLQTSAMPADTAVVGDFARGAVGLRQSIELEATRQGDGAFGKGQVLIRAMMRFDYQPLYAGKGFRTISGIVPPAP